MRVYQFRHLGIKVYAIALLVNTAFRTTTLRGAKYNLYIFTMETTFVQTI